MNDSQPLPDALDQRIDAALRRRFVLPAGLETLAARARPTPGRRFSPWLVFAVGAAASALFFLFAWLWTKRPAAEPETGRRVELAAAGVLPLAEPAFCRLIGPLLDGQPEPGRMHSPDLARLYSDMDACQRDTSAAACGQADQLAERLSATYGQPFALRPEAAGRLHGPFGSDEWPTATIVTGTSDDRTAVLVADRDATLACCVRMQLSEGSGLRLFISQVGEVVLTEITPLSEPRLLPYFE